MNKRYILGVDESNHGKFPEIFTCCLSYNLKLEKRGSFNKVRSGNNGVGKYCDRKTTVFYVKCNLMNLKGLPRHRIKGGIVRCLLEGDIPDNLKIYYDGNPESGERGYLQYILTDRTGLTQDNLEIVMESQLDEKIKIVNMADRFANTLFHQVLKTSRMGGIKSFGAIEKEFKREFF